MAAPAASPTQAFVPVKEIRNGIIILKDGSYRSVLMCSSINFALKAAEEQRAITEGFQNFLNTLDFSIQILVNSRRMDVRPYLALLEAKAPDQKTELLRIQLHGYIEFVRSLSEQTNIMTKTFYVVVPYYQHPNAVKVASSLNFLSYGRQSTPTTEESDASFEENRTQLEQRLALIASGLENTGVHAIPLTTEQLIELLYRSFNPGELENPIRLEA